MPKEIEISITSPDTRTKLGALRVTIEVGVVYPVFVTNLERGKEVALFQIIVPSDNTVVVA